ncbi:MAG TPA: GreA/GreB family elongation factor [Bacillales bacterium]|nr:GreA/GreB family elongation factor [Bacillales bacterium]
MEEQTYVFTPEGIKRLAAELEELELEQEEMRQANPEADVSFFAERIGTLKQLMAGAVISEGPRSDGLIGTGSVVRMRDVEFGEGIEYRIVNRFEADPLERQLSEESPLGQALKDRKAGDRVTVDGPGGRLEYEILAVE